MGETSVYYVPESQDAWSGRGDELVDRMWDLGVFLVTQGVDGRHRTISEVGKPLPECELDINQKFGAIGLADQNHYDLVPNHVYDVKCPTCAADIVDAEYEACDYGSGVSVTETTVKCSVCGANHPMTALGYGEPVTFARFYIWVSDCDQETWDPNFRIVLEEIVGPCQEYWEWST